MNQYTPPETPKRVTYICSHCGSSNVKADCYATFYVELQQWEVAGDVFEKGAICEDCQGETRLKEVVLHD